MSLHLSPSAAPTVTATLSFAEMLEKLFVDRYTGSVVLHLLHGKPNAVDLPSAPTRIALDNGVR